jgi:hypothetical protein
MKKIKSIDINDIDASCMTISYLNRRKPLYVICLALLVINFVAIIPCMIISAVKGFEKQLVQVKYSDKLCIPNTSTCHVPFTITEQISEPYKLFIVLSPFPSNANQILRTNPLTDEKAFEGYFHCFDSEEKTKEVLGDLTYNSTVIQKYINHNEKCLYVILMDTMDHIKISKPDGSLVAMDYDILNPLLRPKNSNLDKYLNWSSNFTPDQIKMWYHVSAFSYEAYRYANIREPLPPGDYKL